MCSQRQLTFLDLRTFVCQRLGRYQDEDKMPQVVKPFVAKSSSFGEFIHGHSIAFGSNANGSREFRGCIGDAALVAAKTKSKAKSSTERRGSKRLVGSDSSGDPSLEFSCDGHARNNQLDRLDPLARLPVPGRHDIPFLRFSYAGRTY